MAATATAQVASHAPSHGRRVASGAKDDLPQVSGKTVARVNGAVLSDRDLVREMFAIFPVRASNTTDSRRDSSRRSARARST